ncbi:MAG: FAD-dependent oxidoreductase, partial [Candidatus Sericytochromatia bacterium]|nr:FAD-dependent oxidoreductase [Candidatus Sericytochromatia bacterium]
MLRVSELKLPLDHPPEALEVAVLRKLRLEPTELREMAIFKRSNDARKKGDITLVYIVDVATTRDDELLERARRTKDPHVVRTPDMTYRPVAEAPVGGVASRPVVIGMGPSGLFAGLMLARMGFRPIILERGKEVRDRTADTFRFWRGLSDLNPESNAQFGEGGAGTFSDGKLYSQVRDTHHHGRKVLQEFVEAGASPEILYVNRPHIGTFRLVKIVQAMRATILALGGEVRFQTRVDDLEIENGRVRGVKLSDGTHLAADHVVLAVGHSARDTFAMLHARGVYIEAKPFSIGFRVEHP